MQIQTAISLEWRENCMKESAEDKKRRNFGKNGQKHKSGQINVWLFVTSEIKFFEFAQTSFFDQERNKI